MKIVCLIGSSLFRDEYIRQIEREARKGNAAIGLTEVVSKDRELFADLKLGDDLSTHVAHMNMVDRIHEFKLRCVEKADEVLVLDVGGYIGEHTRAAMEYAYDLDKPVRFFSEECLDAR